MFVLATALAAAPAVAAPSDFATRCNAAATAAAWPEATRIEAATLHPAGPLTANGPSLPAHCELIGRLHERTGGDGLPYAIRFRLRLPETWNGRFLFQGGGGTNGVVGDAVGAAGRVGSPALVRGFAVVAQNSGHDNAVDTVAARNGTSAFGFEPQARADYGGASLAPVARAALAAIRAVYGRDADHRYFLGCSKGGQEGMYLAQREPALFDGIVANAPGFALPRAAIAEAWDTQAFAAIAGDAVTPATLAATFTDGDFALVREAILAVCDADDGLRDGIVGAFAKCTSGKVLPALAKVTCSGAKTSDCLTPAQIAALRRVHDGARDSRGRALYAGFPWDAGWGAPGWRAWKIGAADGRSPAINVAMGMPSLAATFTTPPTALAAGHKAALDYARRFDFDRDAAKIYAVAAPFDRSAWVDIGARSRDINAFADHGSRMIVAQGVSDPVFSIDDTIAWLAEVDRLRHGRADDAVRLFPVPGMVHCTGGFATDGFDLLAAITAWVEQGSAPTRIDAVAGPASPWPGRTRPLCAYPQVARYAGRGDVERAENFVCG